MKIEKDIEYIKQFAKQEYANNHTFRKFLEGQDSDKVDAIVFKLDKEITPQIECVECGNCCKNIRPIATDEVLINFVPRERIEEVKYLHSFQCSHQLDKKCTKYEDRYEDCRTFPYLYRDKFASRMIGILQNYEMCPIVFNVVEQLKVELNWKAPQA